MRRPGYRLFAATMGLAWLMCGAAPQDVPPELFRVTASIGGCAATVVEPFQDKSGKWHWLAITAAHCCRDGESKPVKLLWPPSDKRNFNGKVVYRDINNDVAAVTFNPVDTVPFAKLGERPGEGDGVFTVGYPSGQLKGKPSTVIGNRTTDKSITIADDIWYGNSGGGLFKDGKLVGVASSRTGLSGPSYFASTEAVQIAYHSAAVSLGFE